MDNLPSLHSSFRSKHQFFQATKTALDSFHHRLHFVLLLLIPIPPLSFYISILLYLFLRNVALIYILMATVMIRVEKYAMTVWYKTEMPYTIFSTLYRHKQWYCFLYNLLFLIHSYVVLYTALLKCLYSDRVACWKVMNTV